MDRWALVYKNGTVITFHQLDSDDDISSSGATIFIGTKQECDDTIVELELTMEENDGE